MTTLPRPLRGIIPPLATPLLDRDRLDARAAEKLAEHVIGASVHGIFLLGTTGEAPGLSYRLRAELVDTVCSTVARRVPVLVGITDTSMIETIRLAEHSAKAGADGLVLAPPYYFELSQAELLGYLERLAPELPLPLYLYNIPSLTKTHYAPETVRRAADIDKIYGIKDSSGDMQYLAAVVRALVDRPEFTVFCGPEELFVQAMTLGAHGGVLGGSNLYPELYVELYRRVTSGAYPGPIQELEAVVMRISEAVYHRSPAASSYLRGMKCALSLLGRCGNVLAEPYQPYGTAEAEMMRKVLIQVEESLCGILRAS